MLKKFNRFTILTSDDDDINLENINIFIEYIPKQSSLVTPEYNSISEYIQNISYRYGIETINYVCDLLFFNNKINRGLSNIISNKTDAVIFFISEDKNLKNKDVSLINMLTKLCLKNKIKFIKIYNDQNKDNFTFEDLCFDSGEFEQKSIDIKCSEYDICQTIYGSNSDDGPKIKKNNSFQHVEDVDSNELLVKCINSFNISECELDNQKNVVPVDKKHRTAIVNAKRITYLVKKDEYIKNIKKVKEMACSSPRMSKPYSNNKLKLKKMISNNKKCGATIKKSGKQCTNSAINGTNFCGILSHKKLSTS